MNIKIKEIDSIEEFQFEYSICTLVTDFELYDKMILSLENAGFNNQNTEFIYIDNRNNKYDAYQAINKLFKLVKGRYIVLCHQDIEMLYDNKIHLDKELSNLTGLDSYWALAGNAGAKSLGELVIRITDPHGTNTKKGEFPSSVISLDENFIVINNKFNLSISTNLKGFHFYGTDLCILADIQGLKSYVIDFHLVHYGKGTCDKSFYEQQSNFILKYSMALRDRVIQTTCSRFLLSSSYLKRKFLSVSLLKKLKKYTIKF